LISARCPSAVATRGFTIIELLVVIAVIGLVLVIAVPSVSTMQTQLNRSSAIQAMDATLTRAKYAAAAAGDVVAVRFMPSLWAGSINTGDNILEPDANRMLMVTYEWTTANWLDDPDQVQFIERFEPRPETTVVQMPRNTWIAPIEATLHEDTPGVTGEAFDIAKEVATGTPGDFAFEAGIGDGISKKNDDFMQMDDFLIIFDQEGNLIPGPRASNGLDSLYETGNPRHVPYPILSYYDPKWNEPSSSKDALETDRDPDDEDELFTRYNFGGVALYQRDNFLAQVGGEAVSGEDRVSWLAANAEPQMIHPRSAQLKEAQQ
jgi:prepilin-type N-terminal cleavage/methylation domain-containing protein